MKKWLCSLFVSLSASADTITHTDTTGTQPGDFSAVLRVQKSHIGVPDHVTLRLDVILRSQPDPYDVGFCDSVTIFNGITLGQSWVYNLHNPYDGSQGWQFVSGILDGLTTENQPFGWNAKFFGGGNLWFRVTVDVVDQFGVPQDSEAIVTVIYEYATVSPHVTR